MPPLDLTQAANLAAEMFRDHPIFPRFADDLVVLLVGSTAYGFADEHSDVDVCVFCADGSFEELTSDTRAAGLRVEPPPNETLIRGVPVHYFVQPFAMLEQAAETLDDGGLYMLRYARAVHDGGGRFSALAARTDPLLDETLTRKVDWAQSLLLQRVHVVHDMHKRYQPLGWTDQTRLTAQAALELCCWLDHEPPSGSKWIMEQARLCSSADPIVPAVEGLLGALGRTLALGRPVSLDESPLAGAADDLRDASTAAVDRAGYGHLERWQPPVG